jgi:hypothetical protein
MRGREHEKGISVSGEIDEKKMLGILHLMEHPESLQQAAGDEVRLGNYRVCQGS